MDMTSSVAVVEVFVVDVAEAVVEVVEWDR